MTILIVDDDPNIIALCVRSLAELGAEIRTAASIEDAETQMSKIPPPGVVLLDLILPPYSAAQTLSDGIARLRRHNPDLRIIPITGMSKLEIAKLISSAETEPVISKSEEMTQKNLVNAVRAAFARNPGLAGSVQVLSRMGEIVEGQRKTQPLNP